MAKRTGFTSEEASTVKTLIDSEIKRRAETRQKDNTSSSLPDELAPFYAIRQKCVVIMAGVKPSTRSTKKGEKTDKQRVGWQSDAGTAADLERPAPAKE